MVRKLIAHEYHRTRKPFAALVGFSTLGLLVSFLLTISRWPVISTFASVMTVIISGAFLLVLVLGIAVDLYQSSFGRRGYLTHSLPIKGSTILWAKMAWTLIVVLVGGLWYAGALTTTILAMQVAGGTPLRQAWSETTTLIRDFLATAPAWLLAGIVLAALLMALSYIAQVYFSVSVGSEKRFHSMQAGGPVLLFAVVYLVVQLVMVAGIALVPFGLATTGTLRLTAFDMVELFSSSGSSEVMPLGFIPAAVVLSAVLLWRTVVSWESRVALR